VIKQFLKKKAKIAYGVLNTYLRKKGQDYHDQEWWDKVFYSNGISDRQTISSNKSLLSTNYHYRSVEMLILRHLYNNKISIDQSVILDIGSGSGHWIDFFDSLGAVKAIGMDVSHSSVQYLKDKYINSNNVIIHYGKAVDIIYNQDESFDVVNAVGVMFHIIDDSEWINTIQAVRKVLSQNGLFIISGHFGLIDGVNVQVDQNDQINKRLRSRRRWMKILRQNGFTHIKFYKNNAYLKIGDTLPENNVLIASKK
jgi:SAM-dependent methyltransferase